MEAVNIVICYNKVYKISLFQGRKIPTVEIIYLLGKLNLSQLIMSRPFILGLVELAFTQQRK